MKKCISDEEIKFLQEKAGHSLTAEKYDQAVFYLTQLINKSDPQPSYLRDRALAYDGLLQFNESIKDIKMAIQLDPDDSENYWMLGGYLVSNEMLIHGRLADPLSKHNLGLAANNYRIALEKDPTNECAWLNIIEITILTNDLENAICYFGSSKPYIKSLPFRLIRSFLSCLALILSGEEIDPDDLKILNDSSIRISNHNYRACEIESMITELELTLFEGNRITGAKEILKLFLAHYEDEPRRYGLPNSNTESDEH